MCASELLCIGWEFCFLLLSNALHVHTIREHIAAQVVDVCVPFVMCLILPDYILAACSSYQYCGRTVAFD